MNETTAANVQADILTIRPPGSAEVIRIAPDGKLFWHGREVDTDADFRAAMLELVVYFKASMGEIAPRFAPAPEGPDGWRDPKDKPENLPGEHHSRDVLLQMKPRGWIGWAEQPFTIGHVSCEHWRPRGGNGNFDDDVIGWRDLPQPIQQPQPRSEDQPRLECLSLSSHCRRNNPHVTSPCCALYEQYAACPIPSKESK